MKQKKRLFLSYILVFLLIAPGVVALEGADFAIYTGSGTWDPSIVAFENLNNSMVAIYGEKITKNTKINAILIEFDSRMFDFEKGNHKMKEKCWHKDYTQHARTKIKLR